MPVHSFTGELLDSAGWSLERDGWKLPPKFDRELELYNFHRAAPAAAERASW